jgi:hypothetical protein
MASGRFTGGGGSAWPPFPFVGSAPVQGPTRYTMTLNLKTAKTFRLTIPSGLIATADEVIE